MLGKDKDSSEVTLIVFPPARLPRAAAQISKPISGLRRKQKSSQAPEQLEVIVFCFFFFFFFPGQGWGRAIREGGGVGGGIINSFKALSSRHPPKPSDPPISRASRPLKKKATQHSPKDRDGGKCNSSYWGGKPQMVWK